MKLAFWNINNKDLSNSLVDLVNENEIDILILAESKEDCVLDFISKQMKINPSRQFNHINNSKIDLLAIYDNNVIQTNSSLFPSPRWDAYYIDIPTVIKFNLIVVHFHSKVNWSEDSLALECVNLSRDIALVEKSTGDTRTIVIGDFNMNPYESGMVAANGLHALPDSDFIRKRPKGRKIDGVNYNFFYNPMWNYFGDTEKPYGTHYYREPGHVSREWNIYDQVLYRDSLSLEIDKSDITIVTSILGDDLLNAMDRPDKVNYSDHLPITLNIKI